LLPGKRERLRQSLLSPSNSMTMSGVCSSPVAVVLAAGKGTRMGGDLPKVIHGAAGKPLILWVLEALATAGIGDQIVVVGYRADLVQAVLSGCAGVSFAMQQEQRGTGDAVAAAAPLLRERLAGMTAGTRLPVVIVCGDSPLLQPTSIAHLLQRFHSSDASCLLGTALADDPTGLGRIVRDQAGRFERIAEERDASPQERAIREVNMSTYVFNASDLLDALGRLVPVNHAGEYYLTDCPRLLQDSGRLVDAVACLDPRETLSVNTPEQLAVVAEVLATGNAATGREMGGSHGAA
jgi:bifunctional UDP-N-acetylglucosamine pyrophosphorylase/glucosamine-1-phosphate N-acetyltransferase